MALDAGFRRFDTAEADYWYDQESVGRALGSFFKVPELENIDADGCYTLTDDTDDDDSVDDDHSIDGCRSVCTTEDLRVSTKIPPWELISSDHIRARAAESRETLLQFCDVPVLPLTLEGQLQNTVRGAVKSNATHYRTYPLDVYYIHAPSCWSGWHPRCENVGETLPLREAWLAMEAVVGTDHTARRIGLSNVRPDQLLDILQFVHDRQPHTSTTTNDTLPPPRRPDVLQSYADPLRPAHELRRICADHHIEFVSYSTLGTQHRGGGENPVLGSVPIGELAVGYGRSAAEVVLSWAMQRGMSVIPRSSERGHIRQLASLLTGELFLGEEALLVIDTIGDDLHEL